ncbi:hypothetical protein N180_11490 [Pedobacter antarcticus 4BY]|uniref:Putative cysteine ligase BshC n=2 Tax=Pedobacter antarcticus TaxID=34086 RepID=A0A081PM19_9SPHI|nr:bacillithiol biosynthesis cysteine-adding enzyme BshC [Pedobacter antarcticus]KEQ31742.1 hypothetical protein N180_11490 [Pedobacter antarcticus 4BY]SFF35073.1 bacillithiol biosynthesis cysteine-adding enzyme BshC [Pedobacter antarcticus]
MQAKYISYQQTNSFSGIVLDYLNEDQKLESFYQYAPTIAGFERAIAERKFSGDRDLLVRCLQEQYKAINPGAETLHQIELLADDRTFTITTGHQLNIFTGPLYFIYKIVTAINLAAELQQRFPDYRFIPVYWMATEDHDFEEINHLSLEDKKLSWDTAAAGATGRLDTSSLAETLLAYKGYLGISENGTELAEFAEQAYSGSQSLSAATRKLVHALFGKKGLICVDADDSRLKAQFAPVIYKDITGEHSFKNISERNSELENLGYKPQVNPREINFFYMDDKLRERIILENGQYQVMHTDIRFTEESLLAEIQAHPEKFSPNVVMRPLYQEIILPNLAYIGGGAEVTYWLQLKSNFDFFQVPFPVLVLRNSALVIDSRAARKMHILGIDQISLFLDNEQLKNQWVKTNVGDSLCLDDEQRAIRAVFDQIKLNAYKIDKTLSMSADGAKTKALKLVTNLEKKMLRAEKRRHNTSLLQIDKLKNDLFPSGVLQERVLNIAPMYINYGGDFIDSLCATFKPLDKQFTILYE